MPVIKYLVVAQESGVRNKYKEREIDVDVMDIEYPASSPIQISQEDSLEDWITFNNACVKLQHDPSLTMLITSGPVNSLPHVSIRMYQGSDPIIRRLSNESQVTSQLWCAETTEKFMSHKFH